MNMLITMLLGVCEQGIIYAIMALGIYITYKILDFPDLTVDGSFPLGAAVTVSLLERGVNPYITLAAAFFAGVLAGIVTGIIHVKCQVRDLLSGIIVMTGLYTVNLRIAGSANVPIFGKETIFDNAFLNALLPESCRRFQTLGVAVVVALVSKYMLDIYLRTKSGYLLRAAGDNEVLVTSLAKDSGLVKILGLAVSNGLVALSGCVLCQQQRYFDVSCGTGTMVLGLASVIMGTALLGKVKFIRPTSAVVIGSILYKLCVAFAIKCNLSANDLKLVTAVLFLVILVLCMDRKRGKQSA